MQKNPGWKCLLNVSKLVVSLEENPVICDCKDYNIISSMPFSSWLYDVNCAAPSELVNEKVSVPQVYASGIRLELTSVLYIKFKKCSGLAEMGDRFAKIDAGLPASVNRKSAVLLCPFLWGSWVPI